MAIDIRKLQYFAAVVEEETISAAARKLHVSQPPMSAQLRQLEEECGTRLFERGARRITLTEAGRVLYRYAQQILDLENAAQSDLANLEAGKKGAVRLGLISSCDCDELWAGISAYHAECPDVAFEIREGNTFSLLDELERGSIELAVIRTPFSGGGLERTVLRTDPMCIAGTEAVLRQAGCISLRDLADVPLIVYRRWEKEIREVCAREDVRINIACICDDARTSLAWAREGIGAAAVPASILRIMPDLQKWELCEEDLRSSICIVRKKDRELTESARRLFGIFKESAKKAGRG
jgi:DNA-binding transcriptional LysR family regulator